MPGTINREDIDIGNASTNMTEQMEVGMCHKLTAASHQNL